MEVVFVVSLIVSIIMLSFNVLTMRKADRVFEILERYEMQQNALVAAIELLREQNKALDRKISYVSDRNMETLKEDFHRQINGLTEDFHRLFMHALVTHQEASKPQRENNWDSIRKAFQGPVKTDERT